MAKQPARISRRNPGLGNDGADGLGARFDAALRRGWRRYREAFKHCHRKLSTNAVHELRVETRRILSLLSLVENLIGSDKVCTACRRFRRTFRRFSRLRDTHVQLLAFETELRDHLHAKTIRRALQRREEKLTRDIQRQLREDRLDRTKESLSAVRDAVRADFKGRAIEDTGLAAILGGVDNAFAAALKQRRAVDPADPRTIHRLRVEFKRFRYMVEALPELIPGFEAIRSQAMQAYQTRMGEIQDARMLLEEIEKWAAKGKLDAAELSGLRLEFARKQRRLIRAFIASKETLGTFWPPQTPRGTIRRPRPGTTRPK